MIRRHLVPVLSAAMAVLLLPSCVHTRTSGGGVAVDAAYQAPNRQGESDAIDPFTGLVFDSHESPAATAKPVDASAKTGAEKPAAKTSGPAATQRVQGDSDSIDPFTGLQLDH